MRLEWKLRHKASNRIPIFICTSTSAARMAFLQNDNTVDQNLNIDKLTLDDISDEDEIQSSFEESASLWQRHSPTFVSRNDIKKKHKKPKGGECSNALEDEEPYDDISDTEYYDEHAYRMSEVAESYRKYEDMFKDKEPGELFIPRCSQETLSDDEIDIQSAIPDEYVTCDEEYALWSAKLKDRKRKTEMESVEEEKEDEGDEEEGEGEIKKDRKSCVICVAELEISPLSTEGMSYNNKVQETKYNYTEVLGKSILFYEAQRSGRLPLNKRVVWRGDSCLDDKGHLGEDLSGGWYDSGNFIKFGLPMAWSTTVLAWGLISFKGAYKHAGLLNSILECIKWPADYFIKCHTKKYEFYYQVGDPVKDQDRWGRAEGMALPRPSFKVDRENPGSDVVGETVAALAACAIAFNDTDPSFSSLLLKHAKQLYKFADRYRSNYPSQEHYTTTKSYGNKLCWAAAWMHYATNKTKYLNHAKDLYNDFQLCDPSYSFAWDDSGPGVQMLMHLLTGDEIYRDHFVEYMDKWLPFVEVPYTRKGLVYRNPWGCLRYAGNNAFLALMAANSGIRMEHYIDFAIQQIHYILGDAGRSYVCGFGENHPVRPHHRESSISSTGAGPHGIDALYSEEPNPHCLEGALVGGPDMEDYYTDNRQDYRANEVTCDFNAGFQSAISGLLHFSLLDML